MLACLGWLVAEFVHLPAKQFSNPVALDAIYQIPLVGWVQILTFISLVELATFKMMYDPSRRAGDLGFDPLKMDSPAMRLKEVKNGRLAMIGISALGVWSPDRVAGAADWLFFVSICGSSTRASWPCCLDFLVPVSNRLLPFPIWCLTVYLPSLMSHHTVGLIFQQLVFHKPTISQLTQGVTL